MQYLLLIYSAENVEAGLDQGAVMTEYGEFTQGIVQSGAFKSADRLRPVSDATTVRIRDGKTLTNTQFCGTSAAVPGIAGAAALLESAGFNRGQVLKALRGTAVPLGAAAWDPAYGFGLADAAAAFKSGGN